MSVARTFPGMASYNGRIYVVGGGAAAGSTSSFESYDPATNSWTTLPSALSSRAIANLVELGGSLYYVGGCYGSDCNAGITGAMEAYSVSGNSWASRAPMITPRNSFAAAAVNGRLYAVGGRSQCGPCTALSSVEAYDPSTDTWISRASLPVARHSMTAVSFGGRLYVIGGVNGAGVEQSSVEVYDPATNTWTSGTAMITARQGLGGAPISTGFFAIGGFGAGTNRGENEYWASGSNSWFTRAPMPFLRYQVVAAEAGGVIYVTGSGPGNSTSNRLHVYFPP